MNTRAFCRLQSGVLGEANKQTSRSRGVAALHTSRISARRQHIHTSPSKRDVTLGASPGFVPESGSGPPPPPSALAALPFSSILRTYLITAISSSPTLLNASNVALRRMLEANNAFLDPDRNPVLRAALWETFYKQFCAGETPEQVAKVTEELRGMGYSGVILEYALEVLKDAESNEVEDVAVWKKGLLDTIQISTPGDYIGLKWSGMGAAAMRLMGKEAEPTKLMDDAMHTVCEAAKKKGVQLLPAAEEVWTLQGFFKWCMDKQRVYNTNGKSVVYNTYQAYLKQMPGHVAKHLDIAKKEGFTLGAKLVRGAYLYSEKRSLIHDTIEDTHAAYDTIASSFIHRANNDLVQSKESWPEVNLMIASHNMNSVQKAQALRQAQINRGEELIPVAYAQLQGMADEVSCSLIAAAKANQGNPNAVQERVFKCTTWGTVSQCLNYLLRRAAENKDAAARTGETRVAMAKEIARRLGLARS